MAGVFLFRFQIMKNTQQLQSTMHGSKQTHCNQQQVKKLQQQLQHIQRYQQWWHTIQHQHNQRSAVFSSLIQFRSSQVLFDRINFLDHQWLIEGRTSSAHNYQQILKQLNAQTLDYPFKLEQVTHTATGHYRFYLIGKPREKNAMASATTATE